MSEHKDSLRKLPDGSLTRDEVNAMLDVIEAWDTDYPWEPAVDEMAENGEYVCYACTARVVTESGWLEPPPDAEKGHGEHCPWMKTREWEREWASGRT